MGSPTIFNGKFTKLLTERGILNKNGSLNENDGYKNLIKNGNFETGTGGWQLGTLTSFSAPPTPGATDLEMYLDTTTPINGSASLIVKNKSTSPTWGIDQGFFYHLGTINNQSARSSTGNYISFRWQLPDASQIGNADWSGTFPNSTFRCYIYSTNFGFYLDPVFITQNGQETFGYLTNPNSDYVNYVFGGSADFLPGDDLYLFVVAVNASTGNITLKFDDFMYGQISSDMYYNYIQQKANEKVSKAGDAMSGDLSLPNLTVTSGGSVKSDTINNSSISPSIPLTIQSSSSGSFNTADLDLKTGNATGVGTNSGDINIQTGTGTVRGDIIADANLIALKAPNVGIGSLVGSDYPLEVSYTSPSTIIQSPLNSIVTDSHVKAPNLFNLFSSIAYVTPVVANISPSVLGCAVPGTTGTASAVTPTFNDFYTSKKILEYTATSSSTAQAGWRFGAEYVGANNTYKSGGFKFSTRFGFQNGFTTGGINRWFLCGMTTITIAPSAVTKPSVLGATQGLFVVGFDENDANFQIIHSAGTTSSTKVNLGASFPRPTSDKNEFYQFDIVLDQLSLNYKYTFTELKYGVTTSGTINTNVPGYNVALSPRAWVAAGAVASAVGMAMEYIYLEAN